MPTIRFRALIALLLPAALVVAGCASQPSYDEQDPYADANCRAGYTLKCTSRTAEEDECVCVHQGDAEQTVRGLIGVMN